MELQKKLSKSGGVTIPSMTRRQIGLEAGEQMSVKISEQGEIVLTRIHGTCMICGGHERLARVKGRFICQSCVTEIIERNLGGALFNGRN